MTVEELFNIKDPDKQIATDGINEYTILTIIELSLKSIVKHHYIYIFTNMKTLNQIYLEFIQTKDQKPVLVNWRDESILSKFSLIKKETQMKTTFKQFHPKVDKKRRLVLSKAATTSAIKLIS